MKAKKLFFLMFVFLSAQVASAYDFIADGICYNILSEEEKTVEVTYYSYNYNYHHNTTGNYYIDYTHTGYNFSSILYISGKMDVEGQYSETSQFVTYKYYTLCYYYSGSVVVPQTVSYGDKEYTVTRIGDHAFAECREVTDITLPMTIQSIGESALNTYGLYKHGTKTGDTTWGNYKVYDSKLSTVTVLSPVPPSNQSTLPNTTCDLYVPLGSVEQYSAAEGWTDFNNIYADTSNGVTLIDATAYSNNTDYSDISVSYVRTFNNTKWQALYVPFAFDFSDVAGEFDIAKITGFSGVDSNNDGVTDKVTMKMSKMSSGTVKANTPYLIRAKSTGAKTISLSSPTTVKAAASNSVTYYVGDMEFIITGTYQKVTNMKTAGYYAVSGGSLCPANSDEVVLSPYRWYLSIEGGSVGAKSFVMEMIEEDEVTAVRSVSESFGEISAPLYNIAGQSVGKGYRGLVIRNGKKYIK